MKQHEDILGVALTKYYWCNENDRIILNKRLTVAMAKKVKEMHGMVVDREPCDQCKKYMEAGIILITIDEEKSKDDMNNPYRTGGWFVVTDDFIKRLGLPENMEKRLLKRRAGFIEHETAKKIGMFDVKGIYESSDKFNLANEG